MSMLAVPGYGDCTLALCASKPTRKARLELTFLLQPIHGGQPNSTIARIESCVTRKPSGRWQCVWQPHHRAREESVLAMTALAIVPERELVRVQDTIIARESLRKVEEFMDEHGVMHWVDKKWAQLVLADLGRTVPEIIQDDAAATAKDVVNLFTFCQDLLNGKYPAETTAWGRGSLSAFYSGQRELRG